MNQPLASEMSAMGIWHEPEAAVDGEGSGAAGEKAD
jgi:hypothetical protein